ncbi:MAG: heme exporter protein CcmB [Deltaproteobacteria bacterium]|nr:heme exporter protein CcmB [Deltaproteobacteria bacterium]
MSKFLALIKKEWILAGRQKAVFLSLLLFSTLVILLIYFGLEVLEVKPKGIVPPVIWLAIVFGGTLQLNRTYDFERDEDVLDGMRLIPDIATQFYLSKFAVNFLMLAIITVFSSFVASILFDYPLFTELRNIIPPLFLGLLGLTAVGTTFSTMVMVHHKRDILLPTIFYPLIAPLSIAVIKSMQPEYLDAASWFKILLVFDIIYVTASLLVFDKMMEG